MNMREQTGVPPTFPTWAGNPNRQVSRQQDQQPTPQDDEEEDDEMYNTRLPSSARRYQYQVGDQFQQAVAPQRPRRIVRYHIASEVPPRRSRTQDYLPPTQPQRPSTQGRSPVEQLQQVQARRGLHWLVYVGVAMLMMLVGWGAISWLGNWWQVTQDDWHYGRPRTYQTDAVVGHGDSASHPSHFIALNLNRRIEILEFPGGDPTKARIYLGPTLIGQGQELAVVTLLFKDVNGDGKPDMVICVQESRFVFINDNGTFRPLKPGENVTV